MIDNRFFICRECGNLVGVINDSKAPIICCGEKMKALKPNTVEASVEKHLPMVEVVGNTVKVTVGSTLHPMAEEHHIAWIYLMTQNGGQRRILKAGETPTAEFVLCNDKAIAVYAYCNLHGLWVKELN